MHQCHPFKTGGDAAAARLEEQLTAAKQADLDELARTVAARAGLTSSITGHGQNGPVEDEQPHQPQQVLAGKGTALAEAVRARLMSAACVQKAVAQQQADHQRHFGAAAAAAAAVPDPASASVSPAAALDEPSGAARAHSGSSGVITASDDSKSDAENDTSSSDLEAVYMRQQRSERAAARLQPPADADLNDATLAALAKLRNARSGRGAAGSAAAVDESASDDMSGSESSDDSGVIASLQQDSDASSSSSDADADDPDADGHRCPAGTAVQAAQRQRRQQQSEGVQPAAATTQYPPPPQSKAERLAAQRRTRLEKLLKRGKRLGQRARRQLYEKLYGRAAHHVQQQQQQQQQMRPWHAEQRLQQQQQRRRPRPQNAVQNTQRQQEQRQQQEQGHRTRGSNSSKEQQPAAGELHPSWEARRQQQQRQAAIPQATMGSATRKVVFGEDGQAHMPHQQQQQEQKEQQQAKKQRPQQQVNKHTRASSKEATATAEGGGLHPSWAAKKRLAAGITAAAPTGKKLIFSDG
jgi:BUD22